MTITQQIAKHLKEFYYGGNWTASNLKDQLADVDWKMATTQVYDFNTIAVLVYHINYYITADLKVLQGGPLDAHDKFSFDCPPIESQEDWDKMLQRIWTEVEAFIELVEQLPDSNLLEDFVDKKYGNYYRNLQGIVEHNHYHLGQIVLIKKILLAEQHPRQ